MAQIETQKNRATTEIGFAIFVIGILLVRFLPIHVVLVDLGLAASIALSVVILMVSLWVTRPSEFSSFPTVLLIATLLRLSLNIATTRLILSNGSDGSAAAGKVIQGFAAIVMAGDFVIGVIVFLILVVVNFLVITKGASRIAEVGARFTLDSIPGKQMAIDADLSAGLIDEREAQFRRRELEEESAFFGAMDGAAKFVRGDAIAGVIILIVNVFGGIIIGVLRHGMTVTQAADIYTKLSVGDGLVTQIPALVVSLAAGLIVSKGGTRGAAELAVLGQVSKYPRALFVASGLVASLGLAPGLPILPFAVLGLGMALLAGRLQEGAAEEAVAASGFGKGTEGDGSTQASNALKADLHVPDVELRVGKHVAMGLCNPDSEFSYRVGKLRRKFAREYGLVIPEIAILEDVAIEPKLYEIRLFGTAYSEYQIAPGYVLVIPGDREPPKFPGDMTEEPAYGMSAVWIPESLSSDLRREGYEPIDIVSIIITHLGEVLRTNLAQLLSYKYMRKIIDDQDPAYRRLLEDICPNHISYSNIQGILKALLSERIPLKPVYLILEAISEIVPQTRRIDKIVEHVRVRLSHQICGVLSEKRVLDVALIGARWESAFLAGIKRDEHGYTVEFDIEPKLLQQFSAEADSLLRNLLRQGAKPVIVTHPELRVYLRMVLERSFPSVSVLSHLEIARGFQTRIVGKLT